MRILSKIKLPAKLEHLQQFMSLVSHCAKKEGFKEKRIRGIELATEEALVNIFNYAYPETMGEVEATCKLDRKERFIIEIVDSGVPFDPRSVREPDVTADISQRKAGGLGVFLIRKLMDEVQYQRRGKKNILKLVIHKKVVI